MLELVQAFLARPSIAALFSVADVLGYGSQLANNGPEPYPSTPQGQKDFLLQCFNDLKLVTDGHCIEDLYWDPVFICGPGQGWANGGRNVVGNTTLFNFTGAALPALDAYEFNN